MGMKYILEFYLDVYYNEEVRFMFILCDGCVLFGDIVFKVKLVVKDD